MTLFKRVFVPLAASSDPGDQNSNDPKSPIPETKPDIPTGEKRGFPKQSQTGRNVMKGADSRIPETKPDIPMGEKRGFPKQSQIGRNVVKRAEKPNSRNKARYPDG